MRRVWLVMLLAACGRIDFDPLAGDAGTPISPGRWAAVTTSSYNTCAIALDGSLWCWGGNNGGALGVGLPDPEVGVPTRLGTATWLAIASSATASHICGIQTDHTLWCWGNNAAGQLGPNATLGGNTGTLSPIAGSWNAVAVSDINTCAIDGTAGLWCWGDNSAGQLATGDYNSTPMPNHIPGSWTSVSAGDVFECAIRGDATLWCLGEGDFGQLGNGLTDEELAPIQVGSGTFLAVATGAAFACGLQTDHHLRCWGDNPSGQLGDGTTIRRLSPVLVGDDGADWIDIAAGWSDTCGRRSDDSLWCWGDNADGQLGSAVIGGGTATPVQIATPHETWAALALGDDYTCALSDDHNVWCAGDDDSSQLGDAATHRTPIQVPGTWHAPVAGGDETCAEDDAGALWCWGGNALAQLGDGTSLSRQSPTAIANGMRSQVSIGLDHACELRGTALWCWGSNASGVFGNGTTTSAAVPESISGLVLTEIASAYDHACGIDGAGALQCWGDNSDNDVTNDLTPHPSPVSIPGTWQHVAVGALHTCGITSGSLECWGENAAGQIGDGTNNTAMTPTAVALPFSPVAITLGANFSCALDATGKAACWGDNGFGELGISSTQNTSTAKTIAGSWLQLATGDAHVCAISTDHSLWCWGGDYDGELGDAGYATVSAPIQIGVDLDWELVTAGAAHTCATKLDHRLFCWGDNSQGQLGDGRAWTTAFAIVP